MQRNRKRRTITGRKLINKSRLRNDRYGEISMFRKVKESMNMTNREKDYIKKT